MAAKAYNWNTVESLLRTAELTFAGLAFAGVAFACPKPYKVHVT